MTMSARHIWGFDRGDTEMRAALNAGWRRADLAWERIMEAGCRASRAGAPGRAGRLFLLADLLARLRFDAGDLRRATAPAARALLLAGAGRTRTADAQRARALRHWAGAGAFIAAMEIRPRARSSLFHLRMEALHRDTYHANLRLRLSRMAAETEETLSGLGAPAGPAHRHYSRWLGEKPGVFDDTRKAISACLLLPDPTPPGTPRAGGS